MKKEEIHLGDIHRILFGQAPPEFLLEVLIRTLIVYVAAIVVMQWLGKRMNGQISIMELAVMVTMGAILSPAMQLPDRGILMALLALLCTLLFLRGINWLGFKNTRFEKLTQGDVSLLVKDGELQLEELEKSRISKQLLYSNLRGENIYHLGKVQRLYFEACGTFSIYTFDNPRPGLPVLPPDDPEVLQAYKITDETACVNCGTVQEITSANTICRNCGKSEWTKAIEDQ